MATTTPPLTLSAATLWGNTLPAPSSARRRLNPCVTLYGPGPAGKQCRDCQHLTGTPWQSIRFRCALRSRRGSNADHRVTWPACGRFQESGREP